MAGRLSRKGAPSIRAISTTTVGEAWQTCVCPLGGVASDNELLCHLSSSGNLLSANRGLRRTLGADTPLLPKKVHVDHALDLTPYDKADWDASETEAFRNRAEGWNPEDPLAQHWMHNRVHAWIGGDMSPGTSPNDPAFFLNHCNVDRIWESCLSQNGRAYVPGNGAGAFLKGHRIDDPIASPLGGTMTPRQVLDVSATYVYDVLP